MGDLISKQALLTSLEEYLTANSKRIDDNVIIPCAITSQEMIDFVDAMPTAYDVEKVVEKLEKEAINADRISLGLSNVEERHTQLKIADTYRQAELIVKDGELDD